ncbi:hypothetical protein BO94DRAFT_455780 [Aspergillus sclerotioniger CBS 115572]|uniref:Prolyl 4-hydroxylase alpha subunit Fe(2+) 2OG dioxygenase domain-containing protein n=1 Tax=Aspergillus sclerotioniger CBS 115572 TaxID=1450535 RepID=A0A317XGE3_9EURO|nr:hypothetical protein BO94DRAFT_455780 [Aspergillus sclerotioniger CBS 115572]PWY95940.1 hypothetical protein BO94DRAFT_455780 [Aspergillus sclerotioniger CBS 115572]
MSAFEAEEYDIASIKNDLQTVLGDIQSTGSFLTSDRLPAAVNPGLHIPSVGNIGLPIAEQDAKAIIQSCQLSPYGKGSETLVDESVRKSWQLDANQCLLQNPQWNAQLTLLVTKAVTGLGLTANPQEVKAELYKLLIYEEGAFFLPHQDSEKADGMFATLAVCLPSKHKGGDVIASHNNSRLTFRTASTSEYGFSWTAWYADVTHEVKPVTSGYRVVLIYNLIHRPSAALLEFHGSDAKRLTRLLLSWTRAADEGDIRSPDGWVGDLGNACPRALVYILDHQYTSAELRFSRLWPQGEVSEVIIFIASDTVESSLEFSHLVDSKGTVVGQKLPFPKELLIQNGISNRDPDKEKFSGFTGNEGASATHFYRATGALIIPERFRFRFILQQVRHRQANTEQLLEKWHRAVLERPDDALAIVKLAQLCRVIFPVHYSKRRFGIYSWFASSTQNNPYPELQGKVMGIAIELADPDLFCRALELLEGNISVPQTVLIANMSLVGGLGTVRASLDKAWSKRDDGAVCRNISMVSNVIREYHSICEQRNQQPSPDVMEWQNSTFKEILSTQLENSELDGRGLAKALTDHPTPAIMAFLKTNMERTTFLVSFMASAKEFSATGTSDAVKVVDAMLEMLFPKIVQSFKIDNIIGSGPHQSSYGRRNKIPPVSPNLVISLIQLADALKLNTTEIFNNLTEYTLDMEESGMEYTFHLFLLPLAAGICDHIEETQRDSTGSERRFIKHMLTKYLTDHVSNATPPPPDWEARTTIRCSCTDCIQLRNFIKNTTMETQDFAMGEHRRIHLDEQLDKDYFVTSTIKGRGSYSLRVEKTQAMLVSNYVAWIARARDAKTRLDEMSESRALRDILGNSYDSIFRHPNLAVPGIPSAPPQLRHLADWQTLNRIRSILPSKRPYER